MERKRVLNILGVVLLFGAAIAWGTSFLILKNTIEDVPTLYVLGIRFFVSALLIGAIRFKKTIKLDKEVLKGGAVIGLAVFFAYLSQTYGLKFTTPGQNAFITSLYCVITPFFMWAIYKSKPKSYNVIAAVMCVAGIGLIAFSNKESSSAYVLLGNALTFVSALFYTLQVVSVDRFSRTVKDPLQLLTVELFVIGSLFLILSAAIEIPVYGISKFALDKKQLLNVLYLTLVCTLFAQFAQNVGQKLTPANQSAIILSLEGVFGTLFSVLMGAESLTVTMALGFAIIFVATLISELKPDFNKLLKRNRGFIGAEACGANDASESKGDKNMLYEINNGTIKLTVSSLGAEMTSLIKDGKERLWQNENGEWDGHAPILFPACGNCALTTGGKKYPMIQHSFGPISEYSLKEKGEDYIKLSLVSDENTKKYYPYDFVFTVTYSLAGDTLKIGYEIENPTGGVYYSCGAGDSSATDGKSEEYVAGGDIYYSCGAHDSFALDGKLEEYIVEFEKDENFVNHVHDDDGYLNGEEQKLGEGRVIDFEKTPLVEDKTFIFKDIASREVTLKKKDGGIVARVRFNGFNNLLFWRPGNGRTVCIEPWLNLPDDAKDAGVCEKEFSSKYGVRKLKAGEKAEFLREIEYF